MDVNHVTFSQLEIGLRNLRKAVNRLFSLICQPAAAYCCCQVDPNSHWRFWFPRNK